LYFTLQAARGELLCSLGKYWWAITLHLGAVANLFDRSGHLPVEPWWFFSFLIQCYILLPVIWAVSRGNPRLLWMIIFGGALLPWALFLPLLLVDINIYRTPLAYLAQLGLGIMLARRGSLKIPIWAFFAIAAISTLGQVNHLIWQIHFPWITLFLLLGCNLVSRIPFRLLHLGMIHLGTLSLQIFLIHGIFMKPLLAPLFRIPPEIQIWSRLALLLIFTYIGAQLLRWLEIKAEILFSALFVAVKASVK
ncbi:MAG: hypothetical protein HQK54_16500, partial [Oligoflexales bacterium]|nr:hypothetical protein [Oligoflexales bacterium]